MVDANRSDHVDSPPTAAGTYDDPPLWLQDLTKRALDEPGLTSWVPSGEFETSALTRVPRFPRELPDERPTTLSLTGVRNEQQSGQLAVISTEDVARLACEVDDLVGERARIPAENVSARFVGYVPVKRSRGEIEWSATIESVAGDGVSGDRSPDLVGDPLLEREALDVPKLHAQPIWLTVEIPDDAPVGTYDGGVTVRTEGSDPIEYDLELRVREPVLPDPADYGFYFNFWMNPSSIAAEYDAEPWSSEHWDLLAPFFEDLAAYNQAAITTAIVDRPWPKPDTGYESQTYTPYDGMVEWAFDGREWSFDFSVFDRYVSEARAHGLGPRIDAFSVLAFRGPERLIYTDEREGERVVEEVELGGERWTDAWTAFLSAFADHLRERGWLEQTWLGIDERPMEKLEPMLALVRDVAPSFEDRIMVAGSMETSEIATDLTLNTLHVPSLPIEYERTHIDETELSEDDRDVALADREFVESRRRDGKITTFYVAGTPSHPNLLSFSPAVEARMLPWIAAENDLDGLQRWSYTNWSEDVFTEPVFHYVQGGEYTVYPGDERPLSSIRWELLKEGIEDYELLELASGDGGPIEGGPAIRDAMALATSDVDGREKDLSALPDARAAVIDAIADR